MPKLITARYLLVLSVPTYRDVASGHRFVDDLWYKDLKEHQAYLKSLTLACPLDSGARPENAISIQAEMARGLEIVDLPHPDSFAKTLFALPALIKTLWYAIGRSDVVHTSVAGWPLPLGWIAIPIAVLRRRLSVVIVESAFWRIAPGQSRTFRGLLRAWLSELINRWCVNHASLSIFTQSQYRNSLLAPKSDRGHIISASWIDERDVLSRSGAINLWRKKSTNPFRVLFAGRLVSGKGILILLSAMKMLEAANVEIQLDILGEGELFEQCYEASHLSTKSTKITMLGTVAYGVEFKRRIQSYHAVVVPSITDEQPRIVYDAYSQAVPILASDTHGLRACVLDEKTGRIVPPNDPVALAEVLQWSSENIERLEDMGLAALSTARSLTHQEMHRRRWSLLEELLEGSPRWDNI